MQKQAEDIRNTATLYTVVSLALFLISTSIMLNNYRDTRRMGERLFEAEESAKKSRHQVETLNRQVFVDPLTRVRNRAGYEDYMKQLAERISQGETTELAIGVFDCDNLKKINDLLGHDKGSLYLQAASRLICRVFQHSPVFRTGGDEFVVVLKGEDFENRDELLQKFEEGQAAVSASAQNEWDKVSVSSGVAVYDPQTDSSFNDLVHRADQLMYDNKRKRKKLRDMPA